MKVNAGSAQSINNKPKKMSKEDIEARVRAKFGKVAEKKAPEPKPDTTEIHSKGVSHSDEESFGDIKQNDPGSDITQEKLRGILKNGGFNFNDKERKALGQILL